MVELRISFLGFGGVGRALAQMLASKDELLRRDHGITTKIVGVSDLQLGSAFSEHGLDAATLTKVPRQKGALASLPGGSEDPDNDRLLAPGSTDVLVEVSYTNPDDGEPALSFCRRAIENGITVVTTNKGPVAFGLTSLESSGAENDSGFFYEGSVMSGTPVISLARECLPATEINSFRGIMNGTANYILGRMEDGSALESAIAEAQELGYAEADPTADVEGFDVMMKVIIMSRVLFGQNLKPSDVDRRGITHITQEMIDEAVDAKKRWKLIGSGGFDDSGKYRAEVRARCIDQTDMLYGVNGPVNAITYDTKDLGDVLIQGPGAGLNETAYALLCDIISAANKQART